MSQEEPESSSGEPLSKIRLQMMNTKKKVESSAARSKRLRSETETSRDSGKVYRARTSRKYATKESRARKRIASIDDERAASAESSSEARSDESLGETDISDESVKAQEANRSSRLRSDTGTSDDCEEVSPPGTSSKYAMKGSRVKRHRRISRISSTDDERDQSDVR